MPGVSSVVLAQAKEVVLDGSVGGSEYDVLSSPQPTNTKVIANPMKDNLKVSSFLFKISI